MLTPLCNSLTFNINNKEAICGFFLKHELQILAHNINLNMNKELEKPSISTTHEMYDTICSLYIKRPLRLCILYFINNSSVLMQPT